MKLATQLAACSILALSSCAASSPDKHSAELLAADRAFCADTQARRIEGWVAAYDESGSPVGDRFLPITGEDRTSKLLAPGTW